VSATVPQLTAAAAGETERRADNRGRGHRVARYRRAASPYKAGGTATRGICRKARGAAAADPAARWPPAGRAQVQPASAPLKKPPTSPAQHSQAPASRPTTSLRTTDIFMDSLQMLKGGCDFRGFGRERPITAPPGHVQLQVHLSADLRLPRALQWEGIPRVYASVWADGGRPHPGRVWPALPTDGRTAAPAYAPGGRGDVC
jgi:hypothetical protein